MKRLVLLLLIALCLSCDQDDQASGIFEVTTAGIGIDCELILIDFQERDLNRIQKITGSSWLRYQAVNLDKSKFSNEGIILTVVVRKTLNTETFSCTTMGTSYPWVTVLNAEIKMGI